MHASITFPPQPWVEHRDPAATRTANIAEQYHVIFSKSLAHETTFLKDLSRQFDARAVI